MRCIQAKVFRQDRGVRVDFDHIKISHSSSEVILFIKYRDQFPPDRTQAFQNDTVGQVIGLKTSCQFHHLLQAGFFFQLVDSRSPDGPSCQPPQPASSCHRTSFHASTYELCQRPSHLVRNFFKKLNGTTRFIERVASDQFLNFLDAFS